tara:strand:+ start:368 stop:994 length:627 start_codon:yes stop_codon:yes gene_type:complete
VLDAADKDPELKAALEAAAAETGAQSGAPPSAPVLAETQADVSTSSEKVPATGSADSQSLVEKKKKASTQISSGASAGVDVERSQRRATGLRKSLDKIQNNIEASNKALAAHQKHVQELETMIGVQPDGPAKEELQKVLDNAHKHVTDLEDHVAQGAKLAAAKESALAALEKVSEVADAGASKETIAKVAKAASKVEKVADKKVAKET